MLRVASVKMRRGELIGCLVTGLLVGLAVACSINPQPLPPDQYTYDASSAATPGNGDTSEDGDASLAVGNPAGDAGSATGASADASANGDGGIEADGGDASDDAGDASEADAETDASPDAG